MPLRDHFRPPVSTKSSWQGFHGGWPMTMVQELIKVLPSNYTAEPRANLGDFYEIDIGPFKGEKPWPPETAATNGPGGGAPAAAGGAGGLATATWAPPQPTLTVGADLSEQAEFEVLVFDQNRDRELVAAVEIVSPANKDRPQSRQSFVAKCAALLQKRVCVSLVDLVTVRHFNLYADLLALIDQSDPAFSPPPSTYAVTCRARKIGKKTRLESWAYPLSVGRPLPTLPIWLDDESCIPLYLEASYEEACRSLRIP